jgi:hypothetical protein
MERVFESLAAKIRSLSESRCVNQKYVWPGFDPMNPNPRRFFKTLGIEYDGELFIRYPVKITFSPCSMMELIQSERMLGAALPVDYQQLMLQFGPVHLPGKANVIIEPPQKALRTTRARWCWCDEARPPCVLAISSYNLTSDGNSIGFIRNGDVFGPEIHEFDHERVNAGADPRAWARKTGDSLATFLVEYLDGQP